MELHEREHLLGAIDVAIDAAARGEGHLVTLEGPPGIGKTAVLEEACERAGAAGLETLCARGGELESGFPFGVVYQLLEARLPRPGESEHAAAFAGAAGLAQPVFGLEQTGEWADERIVLGKVVPHRLLHGLYWLVANLSSAGPLLLVVDDAHWADPPSVRWLAYLARRIDSLPVSLLVACRPLDPAAPSPTDAMEPRSRELLRLLLDDAPPHVLQPLSATGARAVVRAGLGDLADPAFCDACQGATGGNPFLLRELLADLDREGIAPTAAMASQVTRIAPDNVTNSIARRLAAHGPLAIELAQMVAVLGADADPYHVALMLDRDVLDVALLAAALADARILEPDREPEPELESALRFNHPIVRESVYQGMRGAIRDAAHRRAALMLADEGAAPERIALHLEATSPTHDPWVVDTLRGAAKSALSRGTPEAAAAYLQRARQERFRGHLGATVHAELGRAMIRAGDADHGVSHLKKAQELENALHDGHAPSLSAELALELGRAYTVAMRPRDAIDELSAALADASLLDEDMVLRLEAELINASRLDANTRKSALARLARIDPNLPGTRAAERRILAHLAYERVCEAAPAGDAVALARRALGDGALLADEGCESPTYYVAAWSLGLADEMEESEQRLTAGLHAARAVGSTFGLSLALAFRASIYLRRGQLAEAEADARNVCMALAEAGGEEATAFDFKSTGTHPLAVAFLIDTLVERGRLDEAEMILKQAGWLPGADYVAIPENLLFNPLFYARAGLHLARRRDEEGIADLREAGRRASKAGIKTPALRDWRSTLAGALARTGKAPEARALAREELELARRYQAPRALGIALRAVGLLEGDAATEQQHLVESVEVLRTSEAALELARSLFELGASRRRHGARAASREPLREALDIADRCGAEALVASVRTELLAAGSRPRRTARSGVDALTACELRVARHAADGMTNREIAESLFITPKTVEWHLRQVYRKLDISGRASLPAAIAGGAGLAVPTNGAKDPHRTPAGSL